MIAFECCSNCLGRSGVVPRGRTNGVKQRAGIDGEDEGIEGSASASGDDQAAQCKQRECAWCGNQRESKVVDQERRGAVWRALEANALDAGQFEAQIRTLLS